MGILDDYGAFLKGKPKLPGFPPMWSPEQEERARANIKTVLDGQDIAGGGDPPELKGLNLFPEPKVQDRLGPPPGVSAADLSDTVFNPTPMERMHGSKPPSQVAFDPSRFADVPGPTSTAALSPAEPPPRPASFGPPPTRTAALSPAEPPRRPAGLGILADQPLTPAKPTGVPTTTPSPSLVDTPPPAPGPGAAPAAPAPPPVTTPPPVIPTSLATAPNMGGGQDFGQGLGGGLGNGSDDLGQGLGGSLGNGSDDLAFAGGGGGMDLAAGESGGGSDGGGGGLGGILGAIGGLAKGLGGGGGGEKASAPPVPQVKPVQMAPMAGDPGATRRAQGAQQVISGLLANPSLIDPRKKQGMLA